MLASTDRKRHSVGVVDSLQDGVDQLVAQLLGGQLQLEPRRGDAQVEQRPVTRHGSILRTTILSARPDVSPTADATGVLAAGIPIRRLVRVNAAAARWGLARLPP